MSDGLMPWVVGLVGAGVMASVTVVVMSVVGMMRSSVVTRSADSEAFVIARSPCR